MEHKNAYSDKEGANIEIHNNNSNVANINISFDDVRKDIENLSALQDSEYVVSFILEVIAGAAMMCLVQINRS